MGLISFLFKNPLQFFIIAIPLLYSIILHEIAHGFVAYLFGDDTAKNQGRLSLNPLKHLDPIGTLALFFVGFGWANPVPIDYTRFKNARLGLICVSLAGCVTNILIAILAVFCLKFFDLKDGNVFVLMFYVIFRINLVLGSFNLIPIPPLDGSRILLGLLPKSAQSFLLNIEPYGFFILIILLATKVLDPVINYMQKLVLMLMGLIF